MSEFKIGVGGNIFCSEWNGNSLNDGSQNSPFAHPADAGAGTSRNFILGSGYYVGLGVADTPKNNLTGDGLVVWDFLTPINTDFRSTGVGSLIYSKIHFKNLGLIGRISNFGPAMNDCVFENVYSINPQVPCYRNIVLPNDRGYVEVVGTSSTSVLLNSMYFEDFFGLNASMSFNFTDKNTIVQVTNLGWSNNMINGIVRYNSVDYELKRLFDGSPRPDADPLIPDIINVYPNVYINNNFVGDPKFIDVLSRTVEPDSDLLKRSNANGFIGGVRPSKKIAVNSSDPDVTITTTNIDTTNPLNWLIQSPATEGFINITWKVSQTITEIQTLFLDALLSFDGSEIGGSVGNNNVPDIYPTSYSPLTQTGLTPNRLTYELRTSQSIAKPTQESQWDNDNIALGTVVGDYYVQEWNTKPTITTVLGVPYGNGNPEAIGGSANGINARWAQARIRLTNNRSF